MKPSSALSAEAQEFVPSFQPYPPCCVNENAHTNIHPPEQQHPLIYQTSEYPKIEFRIPQSSTTINPNSSQVILYQTNPNYAGTPIYCHTNESSLAFYPVDYKSPSILNQSAQQGKSFRSQRSRTHTVQKQIQPKPSNSLNRNSKKSSKTQKNVQAHTNTTDSNENNKFQYRLEDFPSLSDNRPQSEKVSAKPLPSTNNETMPLWNAIAATVRRRSQSPPSNKVQVTRNQSANQKHQNDNEKRSNAQTEIKPATNTITSDPKTKAQAKEKKNKKNKKTIPKTEKNDNREESVPIETKEQTVSESVPFFLDDENAFPALGHDIPTTKENVTSSSTVKTQNATPGLISKTKIKAKQTYQICLKDMFDALNVSTKTKETHASNKTVKNTATKINVANPLDSNPVSKRGKEREQPKPRKPTKLKRIINKELEDNQKQRHELLTKVSALKQTTDNEMTDNNSNANEYTSASCSAESNNETDDDEILDHEPTSQLHTPYAQQTTQPNIKQQIHDAGFREYCSQIIDRQLDELCIQLLLTLKRFQDRKKQQFQSNPERAKRKRRFVHGIREVTKHLRLQRLKCILIAPDCQSIQSEGGLNEAIDRIISLCKEQDVPYIFTLNRQKLGRCLNKISRISAIGIFDYSGADQIYKEISERAEENQRAYKQILDSIMINDEAIMTHPSHGLNSREFYKILRRTFQQQQPTAAVTRRSHVVNKIPDESLSKVLPKVPAHYAHSRQTSDTSTIYIDPQIINSMKIHHTRASSGTFDMGKTTAKKSHQRTLSDGAAAIDDTSIQIKNNLKTHSRTPSGCSAISQIEQQDYFDQSKTILLMNNIEDVSNDNDENRLKSINEDSEENSANQKRKHVEKWINEN